MDDNNIGAINVMGDIPWKHSEEPEELVEGKGFRLFESVHNAKVNEAGQLNRVETMEAVFTSTFIFIAQYNYQKLQSEMENIASPKWRKLQRIF